MVDVPPTKSAPSMNRHQRRRWQAAFRKARLESVPRPASDATKHPMPCDVPGCSEPWMFSMMASLDGKRKTVGRRCLAHRISAT